MTSLEKYYSNPFADDDDETCYAVVDLDRHDDTAATSTPPQRNNPARSVNGLSRNNNENTASAVASPVAALQRQLAEANATNQALHDEYESYIGTLREELAAANAKNSELLAKQTRLESQVRTLTIEKETAEWNVQLGKDRIQSLENNIAALEGELANNRGTGARSSIQLEPAGPLRDGVGDADNSPPLAGQHAGRGGGKDTQQPQDAPTLAAGALPRRRLMPVTHQEHQQHLKQQHRDPNTGAPTATPPAPRRPKSTASVQELDTMLLFHSRRRDEVASELQRLDGARVRNATDRRRLETLESALEEEEKKIGHIRLLLRSQNAIKRANSSPQKCFAGMPTAAAAAATPAPKKAARPPTTKSAKASPQTPTDTKANGKGTPTPTPAAPATEPQKEPVPAAPSGEALTPLPPAEVERRSASALHRADTQKINVAVHFPDDPCTIVDVPQDQLTPMDVWNVYSPVRYVSRKEQRLLEKQRRTRTTEMVDYCAALFESLKVDQYMKERRANGANNPSSPTSKASPGKDDDADLKAKEERKTEDGAVAASFIMSMWPGFPIESRPPMSLEMEAAFPYLSRGTNLCIFNEESDSPIVCTAALRLLRNVDGDEGSIAIYNHSDLSSIDGYIPLSFLHSVSRGLESIERHRYVRDGVVKCKSENGRTVHVSYTRAFTLHCRAPQRFYVSFIAMGEKDLDKWMRVLSYFVFLNSQCRAYYNAQRPPA